MKKQKVYGSDVQMVPPTGCAHKPMLGEEPRDAEVMLADLPWRYVSWRQGTKGKLSARFAGFRVRRVGHGPVWSNIRRDHASALAVIAVWPL